jgi:hypothetical protein
MRVEPRSTPAPSWRAKSVSRCRSSSRRGSIDAANSASNLSQAAVGQSAHDGSPSCLRLLPPFPDVQGDLCDKVLGPGPHEDDSDRYADEPEDNGRSVPEERQVKNGGDQGVDGLKDFPQRHSPPLSLWRDYARCCGAFKRSPKDSHRALIPPSGVSAACPVPDASPQSVDLLKRVDKWGRAQPNKPGTVRQTRQSNEITECSAPGYCEPRSQLFPHRCSGTAS